jgi:hypothetical protein
MSGPDRLAGWRGAWQGALAAVAALALVACGAAKRRQHPPR